MPTGFELPEDLADSVDIEYLDDEEINNLDADDVEINEEETEIEDKSSLTFKSHTRSVFCIKLSHDNTLAVTGSEDDLAYVWNVSTGTIVLECSGHKDSVISASFSYDDKYVVTGDMSGLIQVWDVGNKSLIWCYEGDELEWLLWHNSAHVLLSGVHSGATYMWQIPDGKCKVFAGIGKKCVCSTLLLNGTQLITGYEDGCLRLWDLKTGNILTQTNIETNGSFHGIQMSADGRLIVTCGPNSLAFVYKTADLKMVATLKGSEGEEIETAAFCPETDLQIVATGSLDGSLCFWDIGRQALRHKATVGSTITNMVWASNAMLFVASDDGTVHVYNGRNGEFVTSYTGHRSTVLDICLSKDYKFMLTASDDETAKVFQLS